MLWKLFAAAELGITVSFGLIAFTILRGLVTSRQLKANRLGLATAILFGATAVAHGYRLVDLLVPSFGTFDAAMRESVGLDLVLVDGVTAMMGLYYWSLRRPSGRGTLYEDLRARQRQGLELNDNVIQGLALTSYALDDGDVAKARLALDRTMRSARDMVSELLDTGSMQPGELVRERPARILVDER